MPGYATGRGHAAGGQSREAVESSLIGGRVEPLFREEASMGRGGAGPPTRGRDCGAEGVAEKLQGGAGSSPRRPGSLLPLT